MRTASSVIIRHAACAGIVLSLSACATNGTVNTPPAPVEAIIANETRTTIPVGKFENPPDIQPASMNKMLMAKEEPSLTADPQHSFGKAGTHINTREAQVNVRSAPSTKSAILTVLKAGHEIRVLETKDNWVRITWMQGVTPRNGWIKKSFVEGY